MFLLCALLFNATGALFASSSIINQAQTFANDDAVLICTGHQFKWISLSTFEQTGTLEFIQPPDDAPTNAHSIKCTFAYLADCHNDKALVATNPVSVAHFTQNSPALPYASVVKNHPYSLASTRAPPVFS
jgi:hypothetical protein|tara:strand:+ start:119 stop:508 length:390 start_codon:yes stop_codon:yes gene_type:complete